MALSNHTEGQIAHVRLHTVCGQNIQSKVQGLSELGVPWDVLAASLPGLLIVERVEAEEIDNLCSCAHGQLRNVWKLRNGRFGKNRIETNRHPFLLKVS